ncbi:helix-turn-helix domain-containing protein [Lachnospiraceae bacterium LCP25S3_G4]
MYEVFVELLQRFNVTAYKVAKETGISQTTFSNWKSGRSIPKADSLQKIADYFNVSVEYLMTGEEKNCGDAYYLNDETAQIAQEIFDNPDMKGLFDIARDTPPERLKTYCEFLKKLHDQDNNL